MTKSFVLESFDKDAVEFDIDSFLTPLFNTISAHRSQMSIQEGQVIEYPIDNSGSKNSESKINAFYRLLGFPAVRSDIGILPVDVRGDLGALSQHGTLNYFNDFAINGVSAAKMASSRENALYEKISFQRGVDVIRTPIPFTEALNGSSRRPSIFPLVVHAAVPIFPTIRRTAPLFYDGDFILLGDQKRLTRPFIEHIVYMRTKIFSGFDTTYTEMLKKQITNELEGTGFEKTLLKDVEQSELLSLKIVNKLLRALKRCAEQFKDVEEEIELLRKDVQFIPAPKNNPSERSGNLPSSISSTLETDDISEKGIESQISAIKAKMADEDVFIKLLPSEFIKKSDRIKRIEDELQNNTISDDIFLSEFNYLTTFERFEYDKQLKILEEQKSRVMAQYELSKQTIMYLNGEITGLSIFDVLCILLALFTVDISSLLAIINRDSLNSLNNSDLYYKTNPGSTSPMQSTKIFTDIGTTITDVLSTDVSLQLELGIQDIQQKVREYFDISESFYKRAQKARRE